MLPVVSAARQDRVVWQHPAPPQGSHPGIAKAFSARASHVREGTPMAAGFRGLGIEGSRFRVEGRPYPLLRRMFF